MRYKLRCRVCGSEIWVGGTHESDVNALVLDDNDSNWGGYLDARYGHGCGDQGHDDGVKQASKLVAHVRRALGFTYPAAGEVRF